MTLIHYIVEGRLDEAVTARLIENAGHNPGTCYGKRGWPYIHRKITAFNKSAINSTYLALVDFMDTGLTCPGEVVSEWLPYRNANMIFRVVVREIESWILADRDNISSFLSVDITKIPLNPETLVDPKETLVNVARASRKKRIREALAPETGSTAKVVKLYSSELIDFVRNYWDIGIACQRSRSLEKCYNALKEL